MNISKENSKSFIPKEAMLILNDCGYYYAISQNFIKEIVNVKKLKNNDRIETIGNSKVLRLREYIFPIIDLNNIFQINIPEREVKFIVIVFSPKYNSSYGIQIESIIDSSEMPVYNLPSVYKYCDAYLGFTSYESDKLCAILAIDNLIEMGQLNYKNNQFDNHIIQDNKENKIEVEYLQFGIGQKEIAAIPMGDIIKINKHHLNEIENVGNRKFINDDNRSIEIVILEDYLPVSKSTVKKSFYTIIPRVSNNRWAFCTPSIHGTVKTNKEPFKDNLKSLGINGTLVMNERLTIVIDASAFTI